MYCKNLKLGFEVDKAILYVFLFLIILSNPDYSSSNIMILKSDNDIN